VRFRAEADSNCGIVKLIKTGLAIFPLALDDQHGNTPQFTAAHPQLSS
jgi:hypothetical protein